MPNEKTLGPKPGPEPKTQFLFNNNSLRQWQARYKAQKAAEAAEKVASPPGRGSNA